MTHIQCFNRNLLERVQGLLRRRPSSYDVVFSVGLAKKEIKAVRILLEATSPILEKKFKLWEVATVREGSAPGIPLPEFDPEAFEVFVKLAMLDTWTADAIRQSNLTQDQILNLISICRLFEVEHALENLDDWIDSFFKVNLDVSKYPLNTKFRTMSIQPQMKIEGKSEFSTLCLTMKSPIVDSPPFKCNGSQNVNYIATKRKILVHGVGFLGPIGRDAYYDVTVRFLNSGPDKSFEPQWVEKRILAQKDTVFRVMFDNPTRLTEGSVNKWGNHYFICYSLKGPMTKSFQRTFDLAGDCTKRDGGNEFRFRWWSNQLAEILYTNV